MLTPSFQQAPTPSHRRSFERRALAMQMLGNFGVGFNHIDIDAAKSRGITVTNTPEVLTDCTADIAMLLMLMVARRGAEGDRQVRNQQWAGWRPTLLLGTKVTGKTLGLIGMGRIGQAVARKAHYGFGMNIIFTNPSPLPQPVIENLQAKKCHSVEAVLKNADFVSFLVFNQNNQATGRHYVRQMNAEYRRSRTFREGRFTSRCNYSDPTWFPRSPWESSLERSSVPERWSVGTRALGSEQLLEISRCRKISSNLEINVGIYFLLHSLLRSILAQHA